MWAETINLTLDRLHSVIIIYVVTLDGNVRVYHRFCFILVCTARCQLGRVHSSAMRVFVVPIRHKLDAERLSSCAYVCLCVRALSPSTDQVKLSSLDMTGTSTMVDATLASPREKGRTDGRTAWGRLDKSGRAGQDRVGPESTAK